MTEIKFTKEKLVELYADETDFIVKNPVQPDFLDQEMGNLCYHFALAQLDGEDVDALFVEYMTKWDAVAKIPFYSRLLKAAKRYGFYTVAIYILTYSQCGLLCFEDRRPDMSKHHDFAQFTKGLIESI